MKQRPISLLKLALLLLGVLAIEAVIGCDSSPNPGGQGCPTDLGAPTGLLRPGKPFPPLGRGWFNGDAPRRKN